MRITSKGQVTIPAAIREKAGLLPATDVEFQLAGKRVILKKGGRKHRRGRKVIEALRGKGSIRMTTDQIMALTRGG